MRGVHAVQIARKEHGAEKDTLDNNGHQRTCIGNTLVVIHGVGHASRIMVMFRNAIKINMLSVFSIIKSLQRFGHIRGSAILVTIRIRGVSVNVTKIIIIGLSFNAYGN